MLNKWKFILTNWVNCYFNESHKDEEIVNLESILNIISHLRENLNLDESKSSKLEAHTLDEFILEKYPEFKFENGTVEAFNEDDLYLVASLILFFVCVNSKNVDLKNAMCSKLGQDDQETIMKFSTKLMNCSSVKYKDVQAAITEACTDVATVQPVTSHGMVAETPPPLRSLHGEVRRLQAALDAERFDRNYLQEELARTNLRVQKLMKDKEQYKLDIVNLKTKISLCGGEQQPEGAEATADRTAKLTRQLEETEERLVQTQGQLEDVLYERDTCKTKVEELKQDRDKWLALSQQESTRVSHLTEELDLEKRNVQSLRELVTELRQHNKLNGLDSSQLECDDPDASIHSLPQNLSVCSEVCANVVEVQLGEERAKIVLLKQEIDALQEHIHDFNLKFEKEKQTYEKIISDRETDIFNLKHRINEEIEEKQNLKAYYNDEISKLNNEINELEQQLKENNDTSRATIDKKMEEIQILQEEKLSLLQSLSDETTKLENIIKDLKTELETEKRAKTRMKESYENHVMKLNEKVLNRNNELVELQNNILEKSEIIESLHMKLRTEAELKDQLIKKYEIDMRDYNEQKVDIENNLRLKTEEARGLHHRLEQNAALVEDMNGEIERLKYSINTLTENCKILEETKEELLAQIEHRDIAIEDLQKNIENTNTLFNDHKNKMLFDLDEKNATISTLQMQLQDEICFKVRFKNEITQLEERKASLTEDLEKAHTQLKTVNDFIVEKDKIIENLELNLHEKTQQMDEIKNHNEENEKQFKLMASDLIEKDNYLKSILNKLKESENSFKEQLHQKLHDIDELKSKLSSELSNTEQLEKTFNEKLLGKDVEINKLVTKCEKLTQIMKEELAKKNDIIEATKTKLAAEVIERSKLQEGLKIVRKENDGLRIDIDERHKEINQLRTDCDKMRDNVEVNNKAVLAMEHKLEEELKKYQNLQSIFDKERSTSLQKHDDTEKKNRDLLSSSKKTLKSKESEIKQLNKSIEELKKSYDKAHQAVVTLENEKSALIEKLNAEIAYKNTVEKEYQNYRTTFENVTEKLKTEIETKTSEKEVLESSLHKSLEASVSSKVQYNTELEMHKQIILQKSIDVTDLEKQIHDLKELRLQNKADFKNEIEVKNRTIASLRKENEQLHFTLEEDNSHHEVLVKEKDQIIDNLEQQSKENCNLLASIRKDFETISFEWENLKIGTEENLKLKDNEINKLNTQINGLQENLSDTQQICNDLNIQVTELMKQLEDIKIGHKNEVNELVRSKLDLERELREEKVIKDTIESEKNILFNENTQLNIQKSIMTQQLSEEISMRKILEEEKKALASEIKKLNQQIKVDVALSQMMKDDKESLYQQLIEERSSRDILEQEKLNLQEVKQNLEQDFADIQKDRDDLENKLKTLKEMYKEENKSKELLMQEYEELSASFLTEKSIKETVWKENESLKLFAIDYEVIQQTLVSEKESLLIEKDSLLKLLGEEKAALDEVESEKKKIAELKDNYIFELNTKTNEMKNLESEIDQLKLASQEKDYVNSQIYFTLNAGLDNIITKLKHEKLDNELLYKLIMTDDSKGTTLESKCQLIINIADALTIEVLRMKELEKSLDDEATALSEMRDMCKQKELQILELQMEVKQLQQEAHEYKSKLSKRSETYNTAINAHVKDIQTLKHENQSLHNDLNDVKLQLELKVHSLKEKLTDNEHLTDKLKRSYEVQIENLNLMITKLTNYLKDKTTELDLMRKEKEQLHLTIEENSKALKTLEDEVKTGKQHQEKLMTDFESERQVLKNMVTVTESVMEDQKVTLSKIIKEHVKAYEILRDENNSLKCSIDEQQRSCDLKLQEKDKLFAIACKDLHDVKYKNENIKKELKTIKDTIDAQVKEVNSVLSAKQAQLEQLENEKIRMESKLQEKELELKQSRAELNGAKNEKDEIKSSKEEVNRKTLQVASLESQIKQLEEDLQKSQSELLSLLTSNKELKSIENQLRNKITELNLQLETQSEHLLKTSEMKDEIQKLKEHIINLKKEKEALQQKLESNRMENKKHLTQIHEDNKTVIINLEQQNQRNRDDYSSETLILTSKCDLLQEYQIKAERELVKRHQEIESLKKEIETLQGKVEICDNDCKAKDGLISKMSKEKDAVISTINKELVDVKATCERYQQELEAKAAVLVELQQNREEVMVLRKENEALVKAVGQRETFVMLSQEKSGNQKHSGHADRLSYQVDNSSESHSSLESIKTITDLEKIIHDKNRTITTLQSDITYLKTLIAESENKLLDVNKELEAGTEHRHQLSVQLKKIVHQKNEEIADLKRQVSKMSATESGASQIIRVAAKYQAMIVKRIAEIKSNTVLKELTNFANANSGEEPRRALGAVTVEDLENFLETTDRHIKRCAEKRAALQKERDRLADVNAIHESEIISMRKFLTELSVSFRTFTAVKDVYTQKLDRVVTAQRTARRKILESEGCASDAAVSALERSYSAAMQDLAEAALAFLRWGERCSARMLSAEKIKRAFTSEEERASMAPQSFQNAGLEVQLDELERAFRELEERAGRAPPAPAPARDGTVAEVRAEYEDKLNRMKAKMKELYQEQIAIYKERQGEELARLEEELKKARAELAASSRAYQEHIRTLSAELWRVGEKYLVKSDEADWLRKHQRSGSLMSLQHVHSSGLVPPREEPARPSDTHSLRSLQLNNAPGNPNKEGRGMHMSDEEGEVFDNRWLKELSATPRARPSLGSNAPGRAPNAPAVRLSELRWRNSLCPPHLKSSYPAETQFAPTINEDEIKSVPQRKEVGITAYKKPGPPTPSKQAGRLSATDSELRESLRPEPEPRKTSTPSRLRSLFRSSRADNTEGTPRTRRLSNIFRKK